MTPIADIHCYFLLLINVQMNFMNNDDVMIISPCPPQCDCFNFAETVDCSRRRLVAMPTVGKATRRLYVEDNEIAGTLGSSLQGASALTLLIAERNKLESVDAFEAFCGLRLLQV